MLPQWGGIFQKFGEGLIWNIELLGVALQFGDGDSGEVQETYEGMVFWFLASLVGWPAPSIAPQRGQRVRARPIGIQFRA
jgi:hypothetical protein